jgi:hypothetical protein
MTVLARLNQYGTLLGREFDETTANNISISGLGTFFSSEFVENIGITTTLVTKTFLTYDPVADDFIGDPLSDALGGSKGTYMRYNTDKSVVVYEEIDEVNDYRDIVKDGLVLDLNASSSLSYPGSGTTWTDLSGNGNNGTLVNGVGYNSGNGGSLSFDGVNDYVDCGSNNTLNFTSSFSVSFWMNNNISTNTLEYFVNRWTYSTGSYRQWSIDSGGVANRINFRISSNGTDGGSIGIFSTNALYSSGWHNICGTWNGSVMILYIDGGLVAGPTSITTMVSTPGQKTFIGGGNLGTDFPMSGNISQAQIYNRALTATEVLQNYNALKSFYGLS